MRRPGAILRRRLAQDAGCTARGSAAGPRAAVRVTDSAAATVTAVTTATDGHAPMRLARGCEPPIAARYTALRLAAAAGPEARYQSRAHQAPAAANSAPPSSRRPVCRATRNPPARPRAATADDRDVGVPLMALRYLPLNASQYHSGWPTNEARVRPVIHEDHQAPVTALAAACAGGQA